MRNQVVLVYLVVYEYYISREYLFTWLLTNLLLQLNLATRTVRPTMNRHYTLYIPESGSRYTKRFSVPNYNEI